MLRKDDLISRESWKGVVVVSMLKNDRLLRACRRQPVDATPVWFMRQAGRYQPEYRELKKQYSLFDIVDRPDVCAEVTLLPVKQLNVDAAILFSDIFTPIRAVGYPVELNPGPVIKQPVRTAKDIEAIRPLNVEEHVPYVLETVRILVRELEVPLIGFAGAPFTLASYLVEGGPSKDYRTVKRFMYSETELWNTLMDRLATMTIDYLIGQINAGCQVVQLFDSWVGQLSLLDYERYVKPHSKRIVEAVRATGTPMITFGVHTGHLLQSFASLGVDVVGVDWREPIDEAWERIGPNHAVQGNLDPVLLFAPNEVLDAQTDDIMRRVGGRPGHIFNLGHGILTETPVPAAQRVVERVHNYKHKEG